MARPCIVNDLKLVEEMAYLNMINKYDIMEKFNVSMKTAERIMKKLNLTHSSSQTICIIKEYLNGTSTKELSRKYSMSTNNIVNLLKRRNIERRQSKYYANFNYFENIDTEDKAYFLGFIYADGNLYKNTLKIYINQRDEDILYKFKKYIKSDHPLKKSIVKNDNFKNPSNMVRIEITSPKIRNDLIKWGCYENKTFNITFPKQLSENLLKHFIRGYMDGDGRSFSYYKLSSKSKYCGYEKYCIGICGTIDFLESLRTIFQNELHLSVTAKLANRFPERNNNIRCLKISGKQQVLKLLDWLYQDSTVFLDRKKEKYNQIPR